MVTSMKSTLKVAHSDTVWLGYIYHLSAEYSIGGVNMGE